MQRLDRFGRGCLDRVGDGNEAGELADDDNEHRRLAFGLQRLGLGGNRCGVDAMVGHHRRIAERDLFTRHRAGNALAGDCLEVFGIRQLDATFSRTLDDRLGERVLRAFFKGSGERKQIILIDAVRRDDVGQLRPAFGQGAGLVDDQRIDRSEVLQRRGFLDQYAGMGTAPGRGHDRHRRGEAERTGAGDDQH